VRAVWFPLLAMVPQGMGHTQRWLCRRVKPRSRLKPLIIKATKVHEGNA
jgi:hypothetical protein